MMVGRVVAKVAGKEVVPAVKVVERSFEFVAHIKTAMVFVGCPGGN